MNSQNRFLLTTLWCLLATLFSVAVLIYFIHHVAQAIQADNIIDDVFCDLKQGVYGLKRSSSGENCPVPDPSWVKQHFSHRQVITSTSQGYVQIVDKQALIDIAKQCDGVIDFTARPGDMLVVGAQVAVVYSKGALSDDIKTHINGHFLCGSSRTPIQDPEYAIHQMVEIAVRALSPSMNDPYTAITCIDKLSVILVELANGSLPSGCSYDDNDQLRLLYRTYEYDGLARASFDQIRQFGATSVAVTIRLLESLERLASHSDKQQVRQFVVQQGEAIEQLHHTHPFCPIDEQDFQASLGQLKRLVHD